MKTAFGVTMGLLLAAGFTMAPARAAVTSTTHSSAATILPDTLKSCGTGINDQYEFNGWCDGTGPTSYRVIALCTNTQAVYGVERWDGDTRRSYADCRIDNMNSTLQTPGGIWGFVECSNNNGTGVFRGYASRQGNVASILAKLDPNNTGSVTAGGTSLCQWDTGGEHSFNPTQPLS